MHTTFVPPQKRAGDAPPGLALVVVCTAGEPSIAPEVVPLTAGLRVGREVEGTNALSLASDRMLSRVHAVFHVANGAVRLADSSTNGTFVNAARVTERVLADRDVIRMGSSVCVVRARTERPPQDTPAFGLVGVSKEIARVRATIALMGPTASHVLVLGATGSGKELVARALHAASTRSGRFVAVNCAAIPDTLAEGMLFGHVAGAFTDAKTTEPGAFQQASGGTLFLDEIGELSPAVQAKLLRVLETQEVTPLGASRALHVDARVVCATHRQLAEATRDGRFRGDLFARIAELVVRLPTLAERREDVLPLLRHFIGGARCVLSPELAEALVLHPWPFNVREVAKLAAHLRLYAAAHTLELELVAERLHETAALDDEEHPVPALPAAGPGADAPRRAVDGTDRTPPRTEVEALLVQFKGNVSQIAQHTGRSRKSIYRWVDAHGLQMESYRGSSAT